MRIAVLINLFCFFFPHVLLSQTKWPPVYEIKADTATIERFDTIYFQRLEDKEGKWTFADVTRQPLVDKFHSKGAKADGIDTNAIHTYWHRYRLKNIMTYPAKISLASAVDYFDVFVKRADSPWIKYKTGMARAWDTRDGLKMSGAGYIPLVLMPHEEIMIYDRRERLRDTNFNMNPHFRSTEKIIKNEYVDYVHNEDGLYGALELTEAFMIGFMLVAFFYNLIFYRIVREPSYIYFSLFLFFLCVLRMNNILESYLQKESPLLGRYVILINYSWAFIYFFLISFFRHFLKTFFLYKKWDRFLVALSITWIVVNTAGLISNLYFTNLFAGIVTVWSFLVKFIPLVLLITLLLFIKQKDRHTRFVLLGAFPMLFLYGVINWLSGDDFENPLSIPLIKWLYGGNFRTVETICVLWFVLFFSLILFMRYNNLRKDNAQKQLENERLAKEKEIERNELIAKQKSDLEKEVAERTADLKKSLEDLKSTQSQLIQSEKMASLGELTAGIAHEIQNPLNFVNNFSEVNTELIEEMKEELKAGKTADAISLADDIKANNEKIAFHGKRADSIVKGMLQHSRNNSGQKELTDINNLVDECLRLSFHGMRAKDKSFNAKTETSLDNSLSPVTVVSQEIGRVLLNLFTNAFYSVMQKKKTNEENYSPVVTASTFKEGNTVKIIVRDNGNGIPQKVIDKIFQPFFTTKPTGEGTGLGLSMSYDIITKGHGGDLNVETKEGEFAQFTIILPYKP